MSARHLGLAALALALAACGGAEEPAVEGGDTGFAAPVSFPTPAAPGSAEPNLAIGPDGAVYLSWLEPTADSAHALRFAVLRGDRWEPARTVARGSDWFVNWADFPSLLVLPDGRIAAHYLQRHPRAEVGYHYDVRVVQSADGGATWSEPVTPHRDGLAAEHGFVSLYAADGDSLGLVWLDGRETAGGGDEDEGGHGGGAMTLRATTLAAGGGLGAERLLDGRICDCCQTSLARTSEGPVVVYRDRTEGEVRDIYLTRLTDAGWEPGRPVHRDGWVISACPVNGPAVAAEGERVAVAWFTAAADTPRVLVAFSDDAGRTFGPPTRVDDGAPAGRVDVELVPGGALVSWIERAGEAAEVRLRRIGADGRANAPVAVAATSGARASGFPRMARSGEEIVLAWTDPAGEGGVQVARVRLQGQ